MNLLGLGFRRVPSSGVLIRTPPLSPRSATSRWRARTSAHDGWLTSERFTIDWPQDGAPTAKTCMGRQSWTAGTSWFFPIASR